MDIVYDPQRGWGWYCDCGAEAFGFDAEDDAVSDSADHPCADYPEVGLL